MGYMTHATKNGARTARSPLDFYPTPSEVTAVLRDWLANHPGRPGLEDQFLDPAAGEGHIIRAMRSVVWGESFWHAIELEPSRALACEDVAENVVCADALEVDWPVAHSIMNPPFSLLDEMWERASRQRDQHGVWVAALTPVAWWNAEKRHATPRPDHLIALGWRPVFRQRAGAAHKGSQDFAWSILEPCPTGQTTWQRAERPRIVTGV